MPNDPLTGMKLTEQGAAPSPTGLDQRLFNTPPPKPAPAEPEQPAERASPAQPKAKPKSRPKAKQQSKTPSPEQDGAFDLNSVPAVSEERVVMAEDNPQVRTKTILILQGGSAFGAYECGVYQALAPHLDNLAVVAGTSIGAINASLIARNYTDEDRGVAALTRFWTEVVATPSLPSLPFFPGLGFWQHSYAVWSNLVFGIPRLYTPQPWSFLAPALATSFYSTQAMEQTLDHYFEKYDKGKTDPRLIVTALDVEEGEPKSFDSRHQTIRPAHVVASASLPPGFPAKEVDTERGPRYYWDGGLWSNTPLREVLNALQDQDHRAKEQVPAYQVYIVDVFPKRGSLPQNSLAVAQRMADILCADKTAYDQKAAEWVNEYINLVLMLKEFDKELPTRIKDEIARMVKNNELKHYPEILDHKRAILHITHINREMMPGEPNQSELDFSLEMIKAFIAQGHRDARDKLEEQRRKRQLGRIQEAGSVTA
jgi:NTE family protein